eukprot:7370980-Heterocapsa_arctica.AAC.1
MIRNGRRPQSLPSGTAIRWRIGSYNTQRAGAGAQLRELLVALSCTATAFHSIGAKIHPDQPDPYERQDVGSYTVFYWPFDDKQLHSINACG